MSYQVLARKWRPQNFTDVVGQKHVLSALANGLSLGRIHHAYLFSGTRGVGKTTLARLLAKGLNCETGITSTPCGVCDNCREIEQGRFVDLIEIDAASRTKVEDTRQLLDNVQYAPARGRFKVYLIDEVHMLSRHSFNALLKTLEEPPSHVKFLLATTDPQKLPVTILSRCLQFHLKALDLEQIRAQLQKILQAEQIAAEPRALHLLARAGDGSMRDALSLTDQAIALGQGQISTESVAQMLGTLDNEQPLAILEALVSADGGKLMAQIQQAASRGVDWEMLLVEILTLLHRIAIVQLLPSVLDDHSSLTEHQFASEQRLRALARVIPATEVQLYYQTLLIGRKELLFAPDKRMGVEMALLRALAFHPKVIIAEPKPPTSILGTQVHQPIVAPEPSAQPQPVEAPAVKVAPLAGAQDGVGPTDTAQLLQAKHELLRKQENSLPKKAEPAVPTIAQPANSILQRLTCVSERLLTRAGAVAVKETPAASIKKEAYRWKAINEAKIESVPVATPKALRMALEYEKSPELTARLVQEVVDRDEWAAVIDKLTIPKLVQQLALNAYLERMDADSLCLHLRSSQRHLNSPATQQTLTEALSLHYQIPIKLSLVEDDNLAIKTPLEWRQAIYEDKLAQARQSIVADDNIQALRCLFDAELDQESIRPV